MSRQSPNKKGNFISSLRLNYIPGSKLTGISFVFEAIPIVSKYEIKYGKIEII